MKALIISALLLFSNASFSEPIGEFLYDNSCSELQYLGETYCQESSVSSYFDRFKLETRARAKYEESLSLNEKLVKVDIEFSFSDLNNVYDPDQSLPVVVRAVKKVNDAFNLHPSWRVESQVIVLQRIPGSKEFVGHISFKIKGLERERQIEILPKVELLLPAYREVITVNF